MSSEPLPSFAVTGGRTRGDARDTPVGRVDGPARRFDDAMRLMEDGRWHAAFQRLAELADAGHAQAARMALLLARRGTSLFGGLFHADPARRQRWERASAGEPRPVAGAPD